MSGALPAWILVMISWLMFSTVDHWMLIFECMALSSAVSFFSSPALTGGSTLDQIVTVVLLLPLPLLPPHAVRARPAPTINVAPSRVVLYARLLMSAPQLSGSSGA